MNQWLKFHTVALEPRSEPTLIYFPRITLDDDDDDYGGGYAEWAKTVQQTANKRTNGECEMKRVKKIGFIQNGAIIVVTTSHTLNLHTRLDRL